MFSVENSGRLGGGPKSISGSTFGAEGAENLKKGLLLGKMAFFMIMQHRTIFLTLFEKFVNKKIKSRCLEFFGKSVI